MEKAELLQRLKEIEANPALGRGFESQTAAMHWAAETAPLLAFNNGYYREFRERAHRLGLNLSADGQERNLQRMIAIIHEAITDLEIQLSGKPDNDGAKMPAQKVEKPLEWPQQVTLAWAFHHVPWGIWASLVTALVVAFGFGLSVGHSEWYDSLINPHTSKAKIPSNTEGATPPKKSSVETKNPK